MKPEDLRDLIDTYGSDVVAHSLRFRRVSNRYPRCVTEAYGGDVARAAADSDQQVAETVAAWEHSHGLPVRDWPAVGRDEGRER